MVDMNEYVLYIYHNMPSFRLFYLVALLAVPLCPAWADDWNEALNGDLSDDGSAPTLINFTPGLNQIQGTMGSLGGTGPLDSDVWQFTVLPGYQMAGIDLVGYSSEFSGESSFMAIAQGSSIDMFDPSLHLSNGLWGKEVDGSGNTHTNLLAILDAGPEYGGIGFDGFLPSGDYTFWIQEGSQQIGYIINFEMTPVPEPGSATLLGLAALLVLRRRRACCSR